MLFKDNGVGYLTVQQKDITKVMERPDVRIVYLTNGEHWVCKRENPKKNEDGTISYKLATR